MVSLPTAVFQGIKQYISPTVDHMEVLSKIATVMATHRETVSVDAEPTDIPAQSVSGAEPWEQSSVSDPTPVSNPADVSVATEGGAAIVIASDNRVKDMPASPRARAHLRMGRTKDGKGRP